MKYKLEVSILGRREEYPSWLSEKELIARLETMYKCGLLSNSWKEILKLTIRKEIEGKIIEREYQQGKRIRKILGRILLLENWRRGVIDNLRIPCLGVFKAKVKAKVVETREKRYARHRRQNQETLAKISFATNRTFY